MKIFGISIVLLLLATEAFANGKNSYTFQKDSQGVLGSIQLQRFDELYQYAQKKGEISVYINVMRPGEIFEKDLPNRIDQGKYFAETKSAIIKDLGVLVIEYSYLMWTAPDTHIVVRPDALLMILNDSRIPMFAIIKDRFSESPDLLLTIPPIAKTSEADITLSEHDSSTQVMEMPPFRVLTETIDLGGGVVLISTVESDGSVLAAFITFLVLFGLLYAFERNHNNNNAIIIGVAAGVPWLFAVTAVIPLWFLPGYPLLQAFVPWLVLFVTTFVLLLKMLKVSVQRSLVYTSLVLVLNFGLRWLSAAGQ